MTRERDTIMTKSTPSRLRRLTSARGLAPDQGGHRAIALLLRSCCAALLTWIGYIHLHLWLEGYRQIPVNGPLFLLDAVAAFGLAALLLAWPRPLAGLLAAGFTASTLGALIISLAVGLFGFRESIHASYVTQSLMIETITLLALLTWTVYVGRQRAVTPFAAGDYPRDRMVNTTASTRSASSEAMVSSE
jgi:hypothetical protein